MNDNRFRSTGTEPEPTASRGRFWFRLLYACELVAWVGWIGMTLTVFLRTLSTMEPTREYALLFEIGLLGVSTLLVVWAGWAAIRGDGMVSGRMSGLRRAVAAVAIVLVRVVGGGALYGYGLYSAMNGFVA